LMDPVENLAAAYCRLYERVRVALQAHLYNARRMHDLQMEVRQFVTDAQNMQERLPPVEFFSLEDSLSKMVDTLQEAEQRATETQTPGIQVSSRVAGVCGRPRVEINKEYLEHVLNIRGPSQLTEVFNCSARTIRRRALDFGLTPPGLPVFQTVELPDGSTSRQWLSSGTRARAVISDSDEALDGLVASILATFPDHGRSKLDGVLRARGFRIPRNCLTASMTRIFTDNHVFIDGKTRLVTGARFSNNNRARTVMDLFIKAINAYGLPSRLNTWRSKEEVAAVHIYGEGMFRLWVDVVHDLSSKWKRLFEDLESFQGLN
ncbi:hypothetical protein JOM56_014184, partial [Amanita muscaria]